MNVCEREDEGHFIARTKPKKISNAASNGDDDDDNLLDGNLALTTCFHLVDGFVTIKANQALVVVGLNTTGTTRFRGNEFLHNVVIFLFFLLCLVVVFLTTWGHDLGNGRNLIILSCWMMIHPLEKVNQ